MEFNDKLADRFADEVEEKTVLYYIYCYFDKDLDRFNQPQISEQAPEFVKEACIGSIKKGLFEANKASGQVLVQLGTFDMKIGNFDIFDKPLLLVDCDKFIPGKDLS